MVGGDGLPIKAVHSNAEHAGANLSNSMAVSNPEILVGFGDVLLMPRVVCDFLLSIPTVCYVVSDSEAERLQKIVWEKFAFGQDFSHDINF